MAQTMIEKVREAIREAAMKRERDMPFGDELARAAIEAMRTPDEAMVEAGSGSDMLREAIRQKYALMIDAALTES